MPKVFVIHPSQERCQDIVTALQQQDERLEISPITDQRRALAQVAEEKPDIVVVGVDSATDPALKTLEVINRNVQGVAIVVVSAEPSQELLLESMRSGSDEFVQFPIDQEELAKVLDRLYRKMGLVSGVAGKVIAVFSAKGGCGATTVACNLAVSIAKALGGVKPACVLDLNPQYGSVALSLDIRRFSHSIADAARQVDRLDEALFESYVCTHPSGADVLPAPLAVEESEEIEAEGIQRVIELCKGIYKFVILDPPHIVDSHSIVGLDLADEVFLLCDLTLPALRNTIRTVEVFRQLEYKKDKLRLIVNRYYDSDQVSLQELSQHVDLPIHWVIPYDSQTAIHAANSGQTFEDVAPGSDLARSMTALARHAAGLAVRGEKKKKFSLFGRKR